MDSLIQLQQKDILPLKTKLWESNGKGCPLLNIPVDLSKMTLDHIHKLNSEPASPKKGTIRNAIEFRANAIEGKITNNWKRYFGADESKHPIDLPTFLRNLADYLEEGAHCNNGIYYIHPSEKVKAPIVSKSNYNKLKKVYDKRAKFPAYPSSKKLTVKLKELFDFYGISPYNPKDIK
jgi:hypothetical protein